MREPRCLSCYRSAMGTDRSFPTYVVIVRQLETPYAGEFDTLTYLSLDKKRMLSAYETDDLDGILAQQSLPIERAFTAALWRDILGLNPSAPRGKRSIVIMERYHQPETVEELLEKAKRDYSPCFNANDIDLHNSYMPVPNDPDKAGICVYYAPDADRLRKANRTVGFDFVRAWPANEHRP